VQGVGAMLVDVFLPKSNSVIVKTKKHIVRTLRPVATQGFISALKTKTKKHIVKSFFVIVSTIKTLSKPVVTSNTTAKSNSVIVKSFFVIVSTIKSKRGRYPFICKKTLLFVSLPTS
jgi:hypothetical protein